MRVNYESSAGPPPIHAAWRICGVVGVICGIFVTAAFPGWQTPAPLKPGPQTFLTPQEILILAAYLGIIVFGLVLSGLALLRGVRGLGILGLFLNALPIIATFTLMPRR